MNLTRSLTKLHWHKQVEMNYGEKLQDQDMTWQRQNYGKTEETGNRQTQPFYTFTPLFPELPG